MENISKLYLTDYWLYIYADDTSGYGVYSKNNFEFPFPIELDMSKFDTEIEAIKQATFALNDLNNLSDMLYYLIDSQVTILVLCFSNLTTSYCILLCELIIQVKLLFHWILSYCDAADNVNTNDLVKNGYDLQQPRISGLLFYL